MKKLLAMILAALLLAGCANSQSPEETQATEAVTETETVAETEATEAAVCYEPVAPIVLENGVTYDTYDLTGDGAADTLLIHCAKPWEDLDWGVFGYHWQFLVNGEIAMEIKTDWATCPEAELYQIGDGRNYLAICQRIDANLDMDDYGLYQYAGGKLEKVCDFYSNNLDSAHIFHYGAQLLSVAGDRILLRCSNQFNATAWMSWDMEFAYAGGIWAPTGNVYPVVYEEFMEAKADGMTANQPFTVYKDITCGEAAYEVEKGGVLYIDRLCVENGQVYFHVTNEEGQEGWLKDPESVFATIDGVDLFGYFEEALFAG